MGWFGLWLVACAPRVALRAEVDVWDPPLGVEEDLDQDGITDLDEDWLGTSFRLADTDSDGVGDGIELVLGIDPLRFDTDGDAVGDGAEVEAGLDPTDPDSDGGGAWDGDELAAGTLPDDPLDDDLALVPGAFSGGGGCDHIPGPSGGLLGLGMCVASLRRRVRR